MSRRQVVVGGAVSFLASAPALSSAGAESSTAFRSGEVRTERHRTAYLECGPASGMPMIFLHGFPELAIVWKAQMVYFAAKGWRCIAPDMRGYGGSSAPARVADYTVGEISTDMVELHQALGGKPAVWVGHDWGAPIAWAMASHHPERCRGIVALCVPYHPRGHALPNMVPLVDRRMYPVETYPVGQWDYWLYYRESFPLVRRDFERDVAGTINALFRSGKPGDVEKPSPTAACVGTAAGSARRTFRRRSPATRASCRKRISTLLSRRSSGRASFPRRPGISTMRRIWRSPRRRGTSAGSTCPSCSSTPPMILSTRRSAAAPANRCASIAAT